MKIGRSYGKYLIIAASIMVVGLLIYSFFREDAVSVEIGRVQRGDMIVTIDGEGKVRSHDRYTVTAPISGKMARIELHEGDRIPMGYLITHIDPSPPRPTEPNVPTQINPYGYKVFAPAAGILTTVFERNERIVQAGTPLVEISKPSKLEIVVDVLSTEASAIPNGSRMLLENWGGSTQIEARVREVEPVAFTKVSSLGVEEQRVNVIADFLKPMTQVGENYRVDVKIVLWAGKDVLKVPVSALFRSGDKWCVYVAENGTAKSRVVEIGHRNTQEAEALSGLDVDASVILHPPNQLADGSRISAQ